MKRFICAFSSDYRPLYRADIYKVLAMPNNFVIHFRYKLKYIEQNILDNIESYIGKTVIIFYTPDNKLDNKPDNISIRKAKLIKAEVVEQTDLFHAYMKLDDFCDIDISGTAPNELVPSNKFFSELDCNVKVETEKWVNKINYLKPYFPDHSFYQIKTLKTVLGRTKKVKVTKDKKGCYYCLNHGTKYLAELSIANPNDTECKLSFLSSSDDISANMQNPIELTISLFFRTIITQALIAADLRDFELQGEKLLV